MIKKKEGIMNSKRGFKIYRIIILALLVSSPILSNQLREICKFKGVDLPNTLLYEDLVMKKGKYDLIILRLKSNTTPIYYLQMKKGGKVLCRIEGELSDYQARGLADLMADPEVPDKPTLKLKRNPQEKVMIFKIETGKKHRGAPLVRLVFQVKYE